MRGWNNIHGTLLRDIVHKRIGGSVKTLCVLVLSIGVQECQICGLLFIRGNACPGCGSQVYENVSTDAGDASLILNKSELVVPIQDPEKLADLFLKVLNMSKDNRLTLGKKNKARVLKKHPIKKVYQEYKKVYEL